MDLDGEKKRLTVPISWHTDGVRIFKQQKAWIYSFSSALKKGPSLESKLLFLVIRDSLLVKHDSHDAVATIIAWVHRALAEGRFPAADASGQPWAANTREAQQAGSLFASGRCFAFSSFRGDWEARVACHKLQRTYNHNNICERCLATKSAQFNYRDFQEHASYLNVQFTHRDYLLMTPPHLQSCWQHVPGWRLDRNLEDPLLYLRPCVVICPFVFCFVLFCYSLCVIMCCSFFVFVWSCLSCLPFVVVAVFVFSFAFYSRV
mgnify:CR=1 FL=1